ncbi:cell division protein SepF [Salirhabdus salicampi]|uniref:cell division protein SepF n=1 Tax=Salirhabdus salicampi TaxID=476102 RepID=UPI0020C4A0D9|nr:cell division protein SepF [Salirhabdus salicampi]MCP8616589.1 cell division protein SepF [Salirhabdus salicampi]
MSIKNKIKSFFAFEDEYEYFEEEVEEEKEAPKPKKQDQHNVVSLTAMQSTSKLVLCEPKSYNEAQEIADHLKNRKGIVINLQRVNHEQAKRIVDFLSGTVYAINGNIQKLGEQTFLCVPDNVDVSGAISEFEERDEQEQRW